MNHAAKLTRYSRVLALVVCTGLTGCATWSTSNVKDSSGQIVPAAATSRAPQDVLVTEADLTNRNYIVIGDISVTVNKTTVFHPDPTREAVKARLQEEGAKLNADAVILVRYGSVGMSMLSWGSLDGKGRAVRYKQ